MNYTEIQTDRKKNGISQTKLAEFSGFTKQKISAWELKKDYPSDAELHHLREVLDELIVKVNAGELNLRGHRNTKSEKIVSKSPSPIKDKADYDSRTQKMGYTGEYASQLSSLYKKAKEQKTGRLKGIGLFSGCGGLDLGFEAAGVDIVGHVEIWDAANKIYEENFPDSKLLHKDINDVTDDDLHKWKKEFGDIDIIVGGPPCQGFSLAGKRDPDDVRSQLYKQYVHVVDGIRPKVFVFENVAKMTSMKTKDGKLFLNEILTEFAEVGYTIDYKILNAYEYGVPQSRERVILVGVRNDLKKRFEFKSPPYGTVDSSGQISILGTILPIRTFRDAMEGLETLENGDVSSNDPLHWAIVHPQHVIEWLIDVPEGMSAHENSDPAKRPPSGFNTTYKRNIWDEPCSTISTNFNMISGCRNVHPTSTRSITIREATRAQSFPDEFVFCGKWGDVRQAIGNAVPPLLAYEIAEEIISQII